MIRSRKALAFFLLTGVWTLVTGCQGFRPVAVPTTPSGPDPQLQKVAVVLATGGPGAPGTATSINLSGDTNVGERITGNNPVHGAVVLSNSRVLIANQGSDTATLVASFSPSSATPFTISLPAGSAPTFVFSNQPNAQGFLIFSIRESIGVVSLAQNLFSTEIPLGAGTAPVAMTGLSDGSKLYTANSGNGTVSVIDARANTKKSDIAVGGTPRWIVASADNSRVYVILQGGGVGVINTTTDLLVGAQAVASGANFAVFDPRLLRLYVTSGTSNTVSILNVDLLSPNYLAVTAVPVGANPTSVAVLADGSRAYVANSGNGTVSVISSLSNTVTKTITVGANPGPVVTASTDSLKVAVLNKGSNSLTVIRTQDDTVSATLPVPTPPLGTPTPTPTWVVAAPQ